MSIRVVFGVLMMTALLLLNHIYSPASLFADVQPIVDQVNKLSDDERQRTLLEEARKQGLVHWYTDMQPRNAEQVLSLLRERHPFLKVEVVRLGHERLINRILTEYPMDLT
jgi:hypothetical protein